MILTFSCVDGGLHPIVGQVWHRFAACLCAGGARYDHYLCSALCMTMHTPDDCATALALIDLVRTGQSEERAFGLNDTVVTFRERDARVEILIEDECDPAEGLFGLAEFRKAVVAWREFLSEPCVRARSVEVDIS